MCTCIRESEREKEKVTRDIEGEQRDGEWEEREENKYRLKRRIFLCADS